jgi:hypothetical protein
MHSCGVYSPQLRAWILGWDSLVAVRVVRQLLMAEANRLGLDVGAVRMTENITATDGGVDARTDFR